MGADLLPLLKQRMAARGLSVRGLARQAGVSHSSVSRLLAGRARPSPGLLHALAPALGCPPAALLAAAGLPAPAPPPGDAREALLALGVDPAPPELLELVAARLERLREYAATAEAVQLAREGLQRKIEALGARGPVIERLLALGRLYLDPGPTPQWRRRIAGSAVLYFLLPVDAIDDFIFPIGYLDDAVAVALAERQLRALSGPES